MQGNLLAEPEAPAPHPAGAFDYPIGWGADGSPLVRTVRTRADALAVIREFRVSHKRGDSQSAALAMRIQGRASVRVRVLIDGGGARAALRRLKAF